MYEMNKNIVNDVNENKTKNKGEVKMKHVKKKKKDINKKFYHYTAGDSLFYILKTGFIRIPNKIVNPESKAVVWFSTNQHWEPTVEKCFINPLTGKTVDLFVPDDFLNVGITPIRIEVDPETVNLKNWEHYKKHSGEPKEVVKGLEKYAKKLGAKLTEWYFSYNEVPIDSIISIEIWDGKNWVDYGGKIPQPHCSRMFY